MKRIGNLSTGVAALALVAATAAPAGAGIHYKSVTTTSSQGQENTIAVEGWVDGPAAKVQFYESANPVMPAGTYLVTRDGGETLLLVNPEERTYAEWNLDAMLQTLGGMMRAMGPMLKFEVSDVEVSKLAEGPGPEMLGLPTTHAKYRTTYGMKVKVMGMGRETLVDRVQDIWTTDALSDPGLGVWLRKRPAATGDPQLDQMITAEMQKVQGFPLKSLEVSTTTAKNGKSESESRTTTEVTDLEREVSIPASTFEVPEGYQRTEVLPTGSEAGGGDDEQGGNPFKRILGGG
jgi:hypothetical protein